MIEKHPFISFVPKNAKYLILGSFPGKEVFSDPKNYDFFYGTKRNQFWPIMEEVYGKSLKTKDEKIKLFKKLKIAITDSILSTKRINNSNLDVNLKDIVYNTKVVEKILSENKIQKIFFSSRFVENTYRRKFKYLIVKFPDIGLITLPSPSPRYAAMTKNEKIKVYKHLLPKLT